MAVKPIPEGYTTLSPSLAVDNAAEAIEFYKRAFGAEERGRMEGPGGTIAHAELQVGDTVLMLADPMPQADTRTPADLGGTAVTLFMYVEDVDAVVQRATDAGATVTMPVQDMFWGDRFGSLIDPYGHSWALASRIEEVPPEEMEERARAAMAQMSG